jgi:3-hydroxybutyryl-CoA dehydratase
MTGHVLKAGLYGHADLLIGDRIETGRVVVTGEMIDRFADLSGDRFALHLSDDVARELGFPRRVAHGLLVLSLIDGLKNTAPAQVRAVASLGWDIRFSAPVLVDDQIEAMFTVTAKRPARDGQRGIVTLGVEARNQDGRVIQQGSTTLMMLP